MTLSLLHVHPATGTVAALTATGGVAVGGYVHHVWRGVGACVTQGRVTHPWYPDGVRRALDRGEDARGALARQVDADKGASLRQCLVMDAQGRSALHSGADNLATVASCCYPGVATAGNLLASAKVVEALAHAFVDTCCTNADAVRQGATPEYRDDYEATLLEGLIDALEVALAEGGDVRGTRSAALRIESFTQAPLDLRVDWCEGNIAGELRALARRVRAPAFADFLASLPRR
ncbi:DUF1028 domain-containing protein [Halomonas sp. YLB-10]|uniref:DUF1028 domain-containing protein n=1 Tax=Halomonas sp. YLB-10 TaxID=2483111 RepID=UPI000F5D5BFC|nr:DUF1028 domain-containing protein [Halomonas sp. YLB-10]RQW68956.1 DUF1028 domain-containing protein [Halomonas sp. YLB-10]